MIAELHKTNTVLLKEVNQDVDDAVIALGVLELGSDGVLVAFTDMGAVRPLRPQDGCAGHAAHRYPGGVIERITHLGLGYRACIDTTHMFNPDEGILVGSTSTGGILCCPEVFHLPSWNCVRSASCRLGAQLCSRPMTAPAISASCAPAAR